MVILPYAWAIFGILLIASELFVPGFVIFFFGAGALVTALLTGLLPGLSGRIPLQLLLWLAASGASLLGLRRALARVFRGRKVSTDSEEHAGAEAVVIEDIGPERAGRVRFQGTSWAAESYGEVLKSGEKVQILKRENLTLIVTRPFLNGDA